MVGIQSQKGERELEKKNIICCRTLCRPHCSPSLEGCRGGGSEKENSDPLGDCRTRGSVAGLHCDGEGLCKARCDWIWTCYLTSKPEFPHQKGRDNSTFCTYESLFLKSALYLQKTYQDRTENSCIPSSSSPTVDIFISHLIKNKKMPWVHYYWLNSSLYLDVTKFFH